MIHQQASMDVSNLMHVHGNEPQQSLDSAPTPDPDVESVVQSLQSSGTTTNTSSISYDNNNNNNKSPNLKKAAKLDLSSADAFPALGSAKPQSKSLFAAFANVKPINGPARSLSTRTAKSADHVSSVSVDLVDFVPTMTPTASGPTSALAAEVKYIQSKTMTKVSMSKRDGMVVFNFRGPNLDELEIAKRMLVARVTPKITATMQIPTNLRSKIVGQGGKVIQGITLRTQINIDLAKPKPFDSSESRHAGGHKSMNDGNHVNDSCANDMDDSYDPDGLEDYNNVPMSVIKFTGDAQGIELAKAEIMAIVGHHAVKKCAKLSTNLVPSSLYPFLLGPHGSKIADLANNFGVYIGVPPSPYISFSPDCPHILPADAESIIITGEEANVRSARAAILSNVADLSENIGEISMPIDKRKHKFILGPSGSNIHELLSITGCIIELPAISDTNNNQITVRGPSNQLPTALQMVMTKSASVQASDFDLTPFVAGAKSTNTAAVYAQYLSACNRRAISDIETATGAQVVFPAGPEEHNSHILEIAGPSKQVVQGCCTEVTNHLRAKGTFFYNIVSVAKELLQHTTVRTALANAKQDLEAADLVFDYAYLSNTEFADNLTMVVFDPNHGPLSAKKGHTKSNAPTLKTKAANDVTKAAKSVGEFTTKTITIPQKHHRYLKESSINDLIAEYSKNSGVPLIVRVGSRSNKTLDTDLVPVVMGNDEILLRGIKSEVEALAARLMDLGEQAERVEEMGNEELSFTVPSKYVAQLVGRGGAGLLPFNEKVGIKKIEIGSSEGDQTKVMLRGTTEANLEVKKAIHKKVSELEDLTTTVIKIPNEYHGKIIGEKGKYVKRLEEKYSVRIEFPRSESAQDPNAITVQGGRKGVKEAVAEIQDLYNYEKANSYTDSIVIPAYVVPTLVGKGGLNLNQLKQLTGARVDVSVNRKTSAKEAQSESDTPSQPITSENATLVGTKEEVTLAKQVIKELVHILRVSGYGWPSITVEVPSPLHSRIIGPGARTLREILAPFNKTSGKMAQAAPSTASDDIKTLVRTIYGIGVDSDVPSDRVDIRFPKNGRDVAIIKGETMDLVNKVKVVLDEKVAAMQAETSIYLCLPTSVFPTLIGSGGAGVQELQSKFNVAINFDRNKGKVNTGVEYPVPEDREDLRKGTMGTVTISGNRESTDSCACAMLAKLPYKKTIVVPATHKHAFQANGGAELRKIRSSGVVLSIPPKYKVTDADDETWALRGDKDVVDKAVAEINAILEADPVVGDAHGKPSIVHTISDIEHRFHRFIIGPKGQTITEIRTATSTLIDVPPQHDQSNHAIVVRGHAQADVELAEQMIREAVDRSAGRD